MLVLLLSRSRVGFVGFAGVKSNWDGLAESGARGLARSPIIVGDGWRLLGRNNLEVCESGKADQPIPSPKQVVKIA